MFSIPLGPAIESISFAGTIQPLAGDVTSAVPINDHEQAGTALAHIGLAIMVAVPDELLTLSLVHCEFQWFRHPNTSYRGITVLALFALP
jgi:hypothetical protein